MVVAKLQFVTPPQRKKRGLKYLLCYCCECNVMLRKYSELEHITRTFTRIVGFFLLLLFFNDLNMFSLLGLKWSIHLLSKTIQMVYDARIKCPCPSQQPGHRLTLVPLMKPQSQQFGRCHFDSLQPQVSSWLKTETLHAHVAENCQSQRSIWFAGRTTDLGIV